MPELRSVIKDAVNAAGQSLADRGRETGIYYKRLSGSANGYWNARDVEEQAITQTLEAWSGKESQNSTE